MDKTKLLGLILKKGYFPRELPPPFNTKDFSRFIISAQSIPNEFNDKQLTVPCTHSIARVSMLRRTLSIPNPISQYLLTKVICDNFSRIKKIIKQPQLSISKPEISTKSDRAVIPAFSLRNFSSRRSVSRRCAKYIIKTDIARFYHSIYTHSIPWVIHKREKAKLNKFNKNLLGNKIDKCLRDGQDGQTIGVPIGPDTSLIIAEIILSACDIEILKKIKKCKGFRYMDDYELSFLSASEAEKALNIIEGTLSKYELDLNLNKTKIMELPLPLEDNWAIELTRFEISNDEKKQPKDLISYFSRIFELAKENPQDSVLRYGIAKLRSIKIVLRSWKILQRLIMQSISFDAGALPHVVEICTKYCKKGYPIIKEEMQEVLEQIICYHGDMDHGSEVAWAIWLSMVLNLKISQKASQKISKMEDSVVALLALDAESKGVFTNKLDKSIWKEYMTKDSLFGEHWLLSYEANIKNWLRGVKKIDNVSQNRWFKYLKQNNVSFYNEDASKFKYLPKAAAPLPGGSFFGPY